MSILKVSVKELEGNTVQAAAMHLFNLKTQKEIQLKIISNCDIAIIRGVHYDWWLEGGFFVFCEA